jgi:predicted outer membrane protein
MRKFGLGAVIGAAVLVSGFSRVPTPPDPPTAAVEYTEFLEAVLAHAQSQLALAEMAQEKSKTAALVAYAKRVAEQRAALIDQLEPAVKEAGAVADDTHTPILYTFKPLTGEAFERAYIAAELEDEQNALDEFQFASTHAVAPELRQLATEEVPELQQDITDAEDIVRELPFDDQDKDTSSMIISPRRRN